jgi:hypothetical protein
MDCGTRGADRTSVVTADAMGFLSLNRFAKMLS